MQRTIKEYHEHLHVNKLDNLERVDKFLETYDLRSLNHEETVNLNNPIVNKENESAIQKKKKLLANKSPVLNSFTGEFYQTFINLIHILLQLF